MNIISTLKTRKSVRKYQSQDVNSDKLNKLIYIGNSSKALYQDIHVEFKLIDNGHEFSKKMKGYGGYFGEVFDAPHYIIALTENKKGFLENLGYRMEQLMIEAHQLELGTCWIELFFNKDRIKDMLGFMESGEVAAITPIGYEKTTFLQNFIKSTNSKEKHRKKLKDMVFFDKWGNYRALKNNDEKELLEIIGYSSLAPSWANSQPWKFMIIKDTVSLYTIKERFKRKNNINYNRLDCGIVMLYFKLVSEVLGIKGDWVTEKPSKDYNIYTPDEFEFIAIFDKK